MKIKNNWKIKKWWHGNGGDGNNNWKIKKINVKKNITLCCPISNLLSLFFTLCCPISNLIFNLDRPTNPMNDTQTFNILILKCRITNKLLGTKVFSSQISQNKFQTIATAFRSDSAVVQNNNLLQPNNTRSDMAQKEIFKFVHNKTWCPTS